MKRTLSSILAVLLMIGMLSCMVAPVSAETVMSGTTGACTWVQEGTVLTISGNGPMEDYGKAGAIDYPWSDDITEVRIEEGVTKIGYIAFYYCEELTTVTIPDSVKVIRASAFGGCSKLKSVTIGSGVERIEESAFFGCGNLEKVYIKDLARWCAIDFEDNGYNLASNPLWYADSLYLGGKLLENLVIPSGVKKIPAFAFHCTNIKTITIPSSVDEIGNDAFTYTWPYEDFVNSDEDMFYIDDCLITSKTTISGDHSIKEGTRLIADEALYDRWGLSSVAIPASVAAIGKNALGRCDQLESIEVAEENACFSDIDGVLLNKDQSTLVLFPGARSGEYSVPSTVKKIGDDAFYFCWYLDSVILPEGLLTIGESAFSCAGIETITIPDRVTEIGASAFFGCTELLSATIGSGVKKIGENAFERCELEQVYISDLAAWCNIQYGDENGAHPMYYATELYLDGELVRDVVIPEGVKAIPSYSFGEDLCAVVIPDSVKEIGSYAFSGCSSLEEIEIGNGIEFIGQSAFAGTAYYEDPSNWEEDILYIGNYLVEAESFGSYGDLVIKEGTRVIAAYAFNYCGFKTLTLPEGLITLGRHAFHDGYMDTIRVPNSLKNVDVGAFFWCTVGEVLYAGTKEQRDGIDIKSDNEGFLDVPWQYLECPKGGQHNYDNSDDATCNQCGAVRNVFKDIPQGAYYYDSVLWAVGENITSGTGNGKFSPDMPCDRGQVVTFLWRAAGCPEPQSLNNPFKDVKKTDYFYKAVLWAVEQGITSGTGNGKFSPNMTCDRSQIVTFLWRAEGQPAANGIGGFSDVSNAAYYATAVRWAVGKGITSGTGGGKFSPLMVCTRGQVVTFLYRAYK